MKRGNSALTPYQARILKRRLAIFDHVQKFGSSAAAAKYHQSERNIQRIVGRQDVRLAISKRNTPSWLVALMEPSPTMVEARRRVLEDLTSWTANFNAAGVRWRFMKQYITESELAQQMDVASFPLLYELALSRHKAKRKRRQAHPQTKVNDNI